MADRKRELTEAQRRDLRDLVDATLEFVSAKAWRDAVTGTGMEFLIVTHAPIPARRKRVKSDLIAAAGDFAVNTAWRERWRSGPRRDDARLLQQLGTACDGLLNNAHVRSYLYVAAERLAGTTDASDSPAMIEDGCLFAKHRDEGGDGLGVTGDANRLDMYAHAYDRVARRPGPWLRDQLRDLKAMADHLLTEAPFKATRHNPWRDHLIAATRDNWWLATGCRPVPTRPTSRTPGHFVRYVGNVFRIVERVNLGDDAVLARIHEASTRGRRGSFFQ